jgi:hypothetical protein
MKKILLMSAFTLCLGMLSNNAHATLRCELSGCATTVSGDAGHTSKKCTSTSTSDMCACSRVSQGCDVGIVSAGSTCGTGSLIDTLIDGRKCCNYGNCVKNLEELQAEETVQAANESNGVDEVFEAKMEQNRDVEYFGYIDGVNRSPTNGRTTAPVAKLDACLSHADVDTIDATPGTASDKWVACVGSTLGCGTTLKNEYCRATGLNDGVSVSAAVCKDRCDCIYGIGTCGGN